MRMNVDDDQNNVDQHGINNCIIIITIIYINKDINI